MAQTRLLPLALAVALALANVGCMTRTVRDTVFDDGQSQILLRGEKRGREWVDLGFDHPFTIAPVRLAHILSRIDMRKDEGKREPAIPLEILYEIAEGMAKAFQQASSAQEVVVQAIRRDKHLGIFDRWYLTSLMGFVMDDTLYIYISRSDWEIPPRRRDRLPETHAGEHPLKFRLVVDRGMALVDQQGVAVEWRDDVFRKPTRTRVTPGGKVVRRTILMETLEDESREPEQTPMEQLTPAQLRELADLEEARLAGKLSEAEYNAARRQVLQPSEEP